MRYKLKALLEVLFLCGHIINGRHFVSRFDSGCSAIAFRILPEYTLFRCSMTEDGRKNMKIIYVDVKDNDCVTRNGEVVEASEKIV